MGTQAQQTARGGTGLVLLTLAAGQFLMTLDSSVMNVSMATVAQDIGTTITGAAPGALLSVLGLGMAVFGVLRSSEWRWVNPKPGAPALLGISLTFWLVVAGGFVVWLFWR